jgi:hypothetical protein
MWRVKPELGTVVSIVHIGVGLCLILSEPNRLDEHAFLRTPDGPEILEGAGLAFGLAKRPDGFTVWRLVV